MLQPQSQAPANATPTMDMLPEQTPDAQGNGQIAPSAPAPQGSIEEEGITPEAIAAHLDALPEEDKAFLAEHLTPEFIRAIALISGPEVGSYLNQYADPNKVLVPVPRELAEQYMAEQQGQQAAPAQQAPQQGQPMPQPQPQAAMPQGGGGMMTPAV